MYRYLLFSLIALLVGCGGGSGGSGGGDSGADARNLESSASDSARIGLIFTDATTPDYTKALVTFTKAELVGEEQRVTLFEGRQTLDLLRLPDFYEFVDTAEVPAGEYESVRITATDVKLISEDSSGNEVETDAKLPSGVIKVLSKSGFSVGPGDVLFLEIDFDMNKALKLTRTGNGKVILRPVIFANIYSRIPDNKFIRVHGVVEAKEGARLHLCQSQLITGDRTGLAESDGRCFTVGTDASTGLFASSGLPAELADVEPGDAITVIGRLTREMGSVPDIDPVYFPAEGLCRFWYPATEPELQPAALDCDDAGVVPEGAFLVNSDGVVESSLFAIQALTVEMGSLGTFARFSGEITSVVDELLSQFDFSVDAGQGIVTSGDLPVQLYPGSRLFNESGAELDVDDIEVGQPALVDAVYVTSNTEPDVLRSPFVLIKGEASGSDDPVTGTVVSVSVPAEMIEVLTDDLDTLIVDASEARIYLDSSTPDVFTSTEIDLDEVPDDADIQLFGEVDSVSGNFMADTIFVRASS